MIQSKTMGIVVAMAVLTTASCSQNTDDSPDFGLYENGEHLAATFFGFLDNFEACQRAARAFNRESQSKPGSECN